MTGYHFSHLSVTLRRILTDFALSLFSSSDKTYVFLLWLLILTEIYQRQDNRIKKRKNREVSAVWP